MDCVTRFSRLIEGEHPTRSLRRPISTILKHLEGWKRRSGIVVLVDSLAYQEIV